MLFADLSTGPTSLIGLLTSEAVEQLKDEYPPSEIASAVALMMGVYGMIIGFLNLGFLLEFISLPILSGFISAVAITIILNQMSSLLGESNVGDGTARQIHDIFNKLPDANGYSCAIGFSGIVLLTILDHAYKRWNKNKILWFLSITRAFLCLVLFTGIGYAVNKNRGDPSNYLFPVAQVQANGQEPPRFPKRDLIAKVAARSVAVFVGSAVEHTAVARAFGVRNNYVTDQSQEIAYYGVTNFFNSFFHAMGVGGAMSRTAVNSACNVKSPLGGLVTTAIVLISIFKLVGTLYWIPKATLAAIIICAVWPLISPPQVFYRYWKSSLADFISSMIAFWVTLFVSSEIGIAASVGFNIVYIVLRQVFTRMSSIGAGPSQQSELAASIEESRRGIPSGGVPADAHVFRLGESLFFANAYAVHTAVLDVVKTHHAPAHGGAHGSEAERNWSVVGEQRVARLRRRAGVSDAAGLHPIGLVVLDFGRANHVDTTAVTHLRSMAAELRKYGGDEVEIRFVGMSPYVRERFERMGWHIVDASAMSSLSSSGDDGAQQQQQQQATKLFPDIASAVAAPRRAPVEEDVELKKMESEYGKITSSHKENA